MMHQHVRGRGLAAARVAEQDGPVELSSQVKDGKRVWSTGRRAGARSGGRSSVMLVGT